MLGRASLWQLCVGADVVAVARIVSAGASVAAGADRRPAVAAELLEVWKGPLAAGPVVFAQHGHGVVPYADGAEQLLFLVGIERVPELAALARGGAVAWASLEEHEVAFPLDPGSREATLRAARDYVAIAAQPDGEVRRAALRAATARGIASGDARVAPSALRDLVAPGGEPLLSREELPVVLPALDDPRTPIGVRVGLLSELERRRLVDAPARWAALLREARGSDRTAVARAAGAHPSPEVTGELLRILAFEDGAAAEAAAVSLGVPGERTALGALAATLGRDDARLRNAAIRGIGGIGTRDAHALLEREAASHADPVTRRRAAAEAARMRRAGW